MPFLKLWIDKLKIVIIWVFCRTLPQTIGCSLTIPAAWMSPTEWGIGSTCQSWFGPWDKLMTLTAGSKPSPEIPPLTKIWVSRNNINSVHKDFFIHLFRCTYDRDLFRTLESWKILVSEIYRQSGVRIKPETGRWKVLTLLLHNA